MAICICMTNCAASCKMTADLMTVLNDVDIHQLGEVYSEELL